MKTAKSITVLAGVLLALIPAHSLSQDFPIPEPFVSGLWEHKIEVTVKFYIPEVSAEQTFVAALAENPYHREWLEGGLSDVRQAANDEAVWSCEFYNREAVGPIYETHPDKFTIILTYACALP